MYSIVRSILIVYAALLPIVNPIGMAPIFAAMTSAYDANERRTIAIRVAVNGMVLLMASLFIGSYVLDFFGVSIGAVQLGGGLVVMISGWRILNQQSNDSRSSGEYQAEYGSGPIAGVLSSDHATYGGTGVDCGGPDAG